MGDRKAHPHDKRIGMRIAAKRQQAGMSQSDLGEKIGEGVTFQQVQKYEKGVNRISATALYDIALALDCAVAEFYDSETKRVLDRVDTETFTKEGLGVMADFNTIEDAATRRAVAKIVTQLAGLE